MKTFVEIGSCYFNTLYPLCEGGWQGVIVEPQAEALAQIPDHDNLTKVEGAISKDFEILEMTRVAPQYWDLINDKDFFGMASFSPHHPIHDCRADVLEKITVGCVPFNFLIENLGIETIDYLKIDTEGYDFDIIKSIDFEKFDIKKIRFEYEHSEDFGYTLDEMLDFLKSKNYFTEVFLMPLDIVAIKI